METGIDMELKLSKQRERNPLTGTYVKGHQPHNKGKKWDEWLDERQQRKIIWSAIGKTKKSNTK